MGRPNPGSGSATTGNAGSGGAAGAGHVGVKVGIGWPKPGSGSTTDGSDGTGGAPGSPHPTTIGGKVHMVRHAGVGETVQLVDPTPAIPVGP